MNQSVLILGTDFYNFTHIKSCFTPRIIPLIIMVILFHGCLRRNANVKADFILQIKDINHEYIWESDKNIWYKKNHCGTMEMYLQSRSVDMFTDQAKETYTK